MIMCNLETHDGVCRDYASATGLPVVAVDYRLAPEHPFPTPVDDCDSALLWLAHNGRVGLDAARIVVAGESAEGGLAPRLPSRPATRAAPHSSARCSSTRCSTIARRAETPSSSGSHSGRMPTT